MPPTIVIANHSSVVDDAGIAGWLPAMQRGLVEHLAPAWGVEAPVLVRLPKGAPLPPAPAWLVELVDVCPQEGALGYHDVLAGDRPHTIVGAKTAMDDNAPVSSVLFHELAEMTVDPHANRLVQAGGRIYWLEVCDPVEGLPFLVDGVALEPFVLEAYFNPDDAGPYDNLHALKAPLSLAAGGYLVSAPLGGEFSQANGDRVRPAKRSPHWLSRRGRRLATVR